MKKEIKNIVFDMGMVLMDFSMDRIIDPYFKDPEDKKLVYDVVWESGEWTTLDKGTISEDEALASWVSKVPERMKEPLRQMFAHWHETMFPVEGMAELIKELKSNGYKCYLLSNTSVRFPVYKDSVESLSLLDGHFISAFHYLLKPDRRIYEKMLDTFGLDGEESFFVDDNKENVKSAASVGMRGFAFENFNIAALKEAMRKENIRI